MINCQKGILMQHKFLYNVKSINFMRILSVAANSNEIYFMNEYNNKLISQQVHLICTSTERDGKLLPDKLNLG